jgi:hypothetical protein
MPVSSADNGDRELELSIQGGGDVAVGDPVTDAHYYSDDGVVCDGWIDHQSFVVEENGAGPEVTVDVPSTDDGPKSTDVRTSSSTRTRGTRPGPRRSAVPMSPSRISSSTTSISSVTSTSR